MWLRNSLCCPMAWECIYYYNSGPINQSFNFAAFLLYAPAFLERFLIYLNSLPEPLGALTSIFIHYFTPVVSVESECLMLINLH